MTSQKIPPVYSVTQLFQEQTPLAALKVALAYHIQYELPEQQPFLTISSPAEVVALFRPIYEMGGYPIPNEGSGEMQSFLLLLCKGVVMGIKFVGWSYDDINDDAHAIQEAYRWHQYLDVDSVILIIAHGKTDHQFEHDGYVDKAWGLPKAFEKYAGPDLNMKLLDYIRIAPDGQFSLYADNCPYYTGGSWPAHDPKDQSIELTRPEDEYNEQRVYNFHRVLPVGYATHPDDLVNFPDVFKA